MAYRAQHLLCMADWNFVFEFGTHQAGPFSFDGDCCVVARNSHAHLLTVGSRNEPVAYADAVGYQFLPIVAGYQKFSLDFASHPRTPGQSPAERHIRDTG